MSQIATRRDNDLRLLVQSEAVLDQLSAALPSFYTPTQFAVIVRTAINKNPKLNDCTRESFMVALLTAAQMGIAPDGRNGHLLPYGNVCTFMPDYKGLVSLVRKNPNVADIYAEIVCEKDVIKITKGLNRDLIHEVDIHAPRGGMIGTYAVLKYRDGTTSFEFMTKEEVDAIRKRSKAAGSGPWVTDYNEMAKKTVIRRLLKLADLSPDITERLAHDPERVILESEPEMPKRPKFTAPALQETNPEPEHQEPEQAEQQQEEQPAQDPEPQQQTAPVDKKKSAPLQRMTKPAKAVVVESEPELKLTQAGELIKLLTARGFVEADLISVASANRWIKDAKTIEELTDQEKAQFIDNFEMIADAITEAKA